MCNMVCDGQIDIATAQQAFATDWIAAYQKYYEGKTKERPGDRPVLPQPPEVPPPPDPDLSDQRQRQQ